MTELDADENKAMSPLAEKTVEDAFPLRKSGRISRDIWATYFKALGGPVWCELRCGQADVRDPLCTRTDHCNVASCG
jgi:hypothetical protein